MARANYVEAPAIAGQSIATATFEPTYWMLIAANAQLGRMEEARRWLAKFKALDPGITLARIRDGQPAKYPERTAAILDGLRRAGLEEVGIQLDDG